MPGKKKTMVDQRLRDDISAVQEVYGRPTSRKPTLTDNALTNTIGRMIGGRKDDVTAVRSALDRARARRDARDGISNVRTRVPREMDDKVLMNAGGYMGGSSMSGRGTMAGELGRKGSMSVREAGEDMNELSKRRRGMETGGGVKIGKPIKGTIGKPQKLYKEKKKKNK
tara:strand:- start:2089 stop:2595 length:507 start_codon:yes stop_codon:yes gene_type:complete